MVDTTRTRASNEAASAQIVGAGAPDEIEVTTAMIEVGVTALYESGAIENPILGNDRELVRRIFLLMTKAAKNQR